RAWRQEAVANGRMTAEQARTARDLSKAFGSLASSIKGVFLAIGAELGPMLTQIANAAKKVVQKVREWVQENGDLIRTVAIVAGGLVGLGTAIMIVGRTI